MCSETLCSDLMSACGAGNVQILTSVSSRMVDVVNCVGTLKGRSSVNVTLASRLEMMPSHASVTIYQHAYCSHLGLE